LTTLKFWRRHLGIYLGEHCQQYREMQDAYDARWRLPRDERGSVPKPPSPPSARHTDVDGAPWIIDSSRLRLSDAEVDRILDALLSQAEVVGADLRLPGVSRDPKDDPLVAGATEGAADYLVSGNAGLLDLGKHENTTMVSPREFVEILRL